MDPISLIRSLYNYFDEQIPNFNIANLKGISPLLNYPKRGIKYTIGEIQLGLISVLFMNLFLIFHLKNKTIIFLKKSFFSTVLLYWLLIINLLGSIPRIVNYWNFYNLDNGEEIPVLRTKLIKNFGKRIYKLSTNFTAVSIASHLLGFLISIKLFFSSERRPIDVDYYLMTYSVIFYARLFFSYLRYKKYFYPVKDGNFNPYNLIQLTFCRESLEEFKALQELQSCSICWLKYKNGDNLEQFKCTFGHIFHTDCLRNWLKRSLTCPMCRQDLYSTVG